jgi:hypothetical protein
MRKILTVIFTFLARFIAVLLAACTTIATVLALLLSSLDHTLLQAETYQRALREHKVYAQLPALISEQDSMIKTWLLGPCGGNVLACPAGKAAPEIQACLMKYLGDEILGDISSGKRKPTLAETQTAQDCLDQFATSDPTLMTPKPSSGQLALLKDLTSSQWDALLLRLLPQDIAQKLTETALNKTLAYFKGEVDTAQLPLAPLKAQLTGAGGTELIKLMLKSSPACTKEQQAQINAGNFSDDESPPVYCAAEGETQRNLSAELQKRLDRAASEIPETVTLFPGSSGQDPLPSLNILSTTPQIARQRIYTGIRFSPLLVLFLLLLVALFGVRSLRGWMRWWSLPIFIGGLITLSIGIASLILFGWAWGQYVIPTIPSSVGPTLSKLGRELTQSLVKDLALWLVLESGLLTLLALGLFLASGRIPPPPNRSLPPLAPPGTPGGPVLRQQKSKRKRKDR